MEFEKEKDKFKDENICFEGGLGSSFEDAAIICGARNSVVGVKAEKRFIDQRMSDWQFDTQELFIRGKKTYDVLTVKLKDGSWKKFYFDITDFYGKD